MRSPFFFQVFNLLFSAINHTVAQKNESWPDQVLSVCVKLKPRATVRFKSFLQTSNRLHGAKHGVENT